METADPWGPTAAERDAAAEYLKGAVSDRRLTLEEFSPRLDAVYAARSAGEIRAVLATVPPSMPARPHVRWPLLVLIAAVVAVGVAGTAAAIGAATNNAASVARECGCHSRASVPTGQSAVEQHPMTPIGAPDPVTCAGSVPFSAMVTATLNRPFWLPLPDRSEARRCFATAHLPTSTRPSRSAIHVHLDLYFMSGAVAVPRGLGVDPISHAHTAVYTDNQQGVVTIVGHGPYTISQLFEEWGHPLGADSIGHMRMLDGYPMHWFVDGAPALDPRSVVLHDHDEIECFQDMRGAPINPTKSYDFPFGY